MKQCPDCLKENADDVVRCEQCGIDIEARLRMQRTGSYPPSPPDAPAEKPSGNLALRVGWLLIVGGFIVSKSAENQDAIGRRYGLESADVSPVTFIVGIMIVVGIVAVGVGVFERFNPPK